MLGSTIIDVAIGVVLTFLGVSLVASAVTEAISSFLKWREGTLLDGIKQLVNDNEFKGVALALYNHALINPLSTGAAKTVQEISHKPAYIDAKAFAMAFYDVIGKGRSDPSAFILDIEDDQLRTAAQTLWQSATGDIEKFKTEIGHWFDQAMDRLSGWYKQRTQWVSFFVALVIAGGYQRKRPLRKFENMVAT